MKNKLIQPLLVLLILTSTVYAQTDNFVVWSDVVGANGAGSISLVKTASNGYGSCGAVSLYFLPANTDGWLEFTVDEVGVQKVIGFSDYNYDNNSGSIDYQFIFTSTGNVNPRNNGTLFSTNPASVGDIMRIERVGSTVLYKKNGTTIHTLMNAITGPLVVDAAISTQGSGFSEVKTSFGAPVNPSVNWTNVAGMSISGSDLYKSLTYGYSNTGATSVEVLPAAVDGWVEMTADATTGSNSRRIGLAPPHSGIDPNIKYSIQINNSTIQVWEYGANIAYMGQAVNGDVLRVSKEGTQVRYYKNGVLYHTSQFASNTDLVADATIQNSQAMITGVNISFGTVNTLPPDAPTGLSPSIISSTEVGLSWTDASTDETGFEIERSLSESSGYVNIATTAANVVTYSDPGLNENTTYYYRIRAINASGQSDYTPPVSITTPLTIPMMPTGLSAVATSPTSVTLSWTDTSGNEAGFDIERSLTSGCGFIPVTTTTANVVTYLDENLIAGNTYYYQIRSVNAAGSSLFTIEVSVTLPPEPTCSNIFCGANGTVGIGTSNIPAGYILAVDGKIMAEGVKVELLANWPDYVFEDNYGLIDISELKKYIREHGHLPNVPSAKTIEKEGIDIGQINVVLLEKVEELSLYLIQMEERMKKLEEENKRLKEEKQN